ncbi:hypothetical protein ACLB2K_047437 [Fragaria x ananassa]
MANRPFVLQEFPSRAGYKRNHPARSGGLQMGEGRATNPARWGLYPRGGVKLQEFPSRAGYKRNHPAQSGLREGRGRNNVGQNAYNFYHGAFLLNLEEHLPVVVLMIFHNGDEGGMSVYKFHDWSMGEEDFIGREDQWEFLCEHFKPDVFKRLSSANKRNREEKTMHHHTGSSPIIYTMEELNTKGAASNYQRF